MAEIENALVDGFPNSQTRGILFARWCALREALRRLVSVEAEWLNGSYVTDKQDPNDIDVVNFIEHRELEKLDAAGKTLLKGLVHNKISQALHGCDSYLVAVVPEDHPQYHAYQEITAYWDKWLGTDREGNAKGYLEVTE